MKKKTLFLYPFFEIVNLLISNKENVIYILFFILLSVVSSTEKRVILAVISTEQKNSGLTY